MRKALKAVAYTQRGAEEAAEKEISELISAHATINEKEVVFDASEDAVWKVAYCAQSIHRIGELLIREEKSDDILDQARGMINKCRWGWLKGSFKVESLTREDPEHTAKEIEAGCGECIKAKSRNILEVDLENPEQTILVSATNKGISISRDITKLDLGKRTYRIFTHPQGITGTTAFALCRIAEIKKDETILDPFCRSGEIAIEACLARERPVRFFEKQKLTSQPRILKWFENIDREYKKPQLGITAADPEMRNVRAAEKNAKIAGCSAIRFSKIETEWLDTRFEKESVDKIITRLPEGLDDKGGEKLLNEFFYAAEYILRKEGVIALLTPKPEKVEEAAKKRQFIIKERRSIWQGKKEFRILLFRKEQKMEDKGL